MANPSKVEKTYGRVDGWWQKLPLIHSHGRLQAFPFVCVLAIVLGLSGLAIFQTIEFFGAEWSQKTKAAVYAIAWMSLVFLLFFTALIKWTNRA